MSRGWDGNFKDSRYVNTGNMVGDFMENDGRMLHESTEDGFTHEIVHRGAYISEDYFFPNPSSKKKHFHYEIHSHGDVVLDGKSLINKEKGGSERMGYRLKRGLEHDCYSIQKEADEKLEATDKLREIGIRFEQDKAKLEAEIDKVQDAEISDEDKEKLIKQLELAIDMLREQYVREVTEEELKIQEELEAQIELMHEVAENLRQRAYEMRRVQLDVAVVDATAAADEADGQKEMFEEMRRNYVEQLKLRMEQMERQQRIINNSKLRR